MLDIKSIAAAFETRTLPKQRWTHMAHLAVAFVYLDRYGTIRAALEVLREQIKLYNMSVGTPNNEGSGYHETITIFWLTIVYHHWIQSKTENLDKAYTKFTSTKWAVPDLPLRYYSKNLLFSPAARLLWVEPDIGSFFGLEKEMLGELAKGT